MSVIDEVKSRIDIVELVSEYVTLQKAGRNFKANCPFHTERTPSFIVTPERQTWHCFGACSTGGDVFNFVMKREGVEFGEALRILAQKAGVTLSERRAPEEDERRNRLVEANEAAAAYFNNALLQSKEGGHARDYLDLRGVDASMIDAFQLGYSPDAWEGLRSHLVGRGFSEKELLDAGLLVESDRGGYDRFRGRLMFPIRDERGRTVGFGARKLETPGVESSDPGGKYVNTPQTPMFDKGGLLYALDRAKEAIRREGSAIVVEGYMDVIAAHQHGRANVVASMGTALTERQIRLLERLRGRVLLALDADAAGIEATLRALQEAGAAGAVRAGASNPTDLSDEEFSAQVQEWSRDALKRATVNFFVVPLSGKDPDEMLRADDGAWDAAVANARPFTEHVFDVVAARKDLSQPAQRAELIQELLPVLRLIGEPTHQAHYVQRLAGKARVNEKTVWQELQRFRPRRTESVRAPAPPPRVHREPQEEFCLALLLKHYEVRADGLALAPELFLLSEHRAIFDAWRETPDLESLRDTLPEELHATLDRVLARDLSYLAGAQLQQAVHDCVARIQLRRLSEAKQASAAALTEPEVQEYMSAALTQALARTSTQDDAPLDHPTDGDDRTLELATALVEDDEMGRRLHRPPERTPPTDGSPQSEGEG